MDGYVVAGCAAIFILLVVIAWKVYNRKRRPEFHTSVVIAESLQPQIICKSVPCQHPYYRVITEYSEQNLTKKAETSCEEVENGAKKGSRKFDYTEWSRSLSLNSIPRKSSHTVSNSRRSSASDVGRTLIVTKTKPYIVA